MGALERRVWVRTVNSQLFANHYILLVAPPGVGKSMVIKEVNTIWNDTHILKVGPDSATKAAMVDAINEATRFYPSKEGPVPFKSLQIAATEFGTLVHEYNHETMNFYNKMWDAPDRHPERLRYGDAKKIDLEYVSLTILGGTQPAYLGSILPPDAFGMGFTARLVLVYCGDAVRPQLFGDDDDADDDNADHKKKRDELTKGLIKICGLVGRMKFTKDAKHWMEEWYSRDNADAPEHPRLEAYNVRRAMTLQKVAMALSAACGDSMTITQPMLEFALDCMHWAEDSMPEVFKGMNTPETSGVMTELWGHCFAVYNKIGKKPVPSHLLIDWLKNRVEIHKIDPIMRHMVNSKLLLPGPTSETIGGKFVTHGERFIPGEPPVEQRKKK